MKIFHFIICFFTSPEQKAFILFFYILYVSKKILAAVLVQYIATYFISKIKFLIAILITKFLFKHYKNFSSRLIEKRERTTEQLQSLQKLYIF